MGSRPTGCRPSGDLPIFTLSTRGADMAEGIIAVIFVFQGRKTPSSKQVSMFRSFFTAHPAAPRLDCGVRKVWNSCYEYDELTTNMTKRTNRVRGIKNLASGGSPLQLEAVQHLRQSPSKKHPKWGFKGGPKDTLNEWHGPTFTMSSSMRIILVFTWSVIP